MIDPDLPVESGPLKRSSLRDDATRTLRSQIIAGVILPDTLYSIGDIAAQLGTSPTPIREALLELESQGLVKLVRNRGFRIREISTDDLNDILYIRLMLEIPALRYLATMEIQPDFSDALRLCERTVELARSGKIIAFLAADRDFHLSLIDKLGNSRLTATVGNLRDQTRLYGIAHLENAGLEASAAEHLPILEAIMRRDVDKVTELTRIHLEHIVGDWWREQNAK